METGTEIIDGVVDNEETVVESGGAGAKVYRAVMLCGAELLSMLEGWCDVLTSSMRHPVSFRIVS